MMFKRAADKPNSLIILFLKSHTIQLSFQSSTHPAQGLYSMSAKFSCPHYILLHYTGLNPKACHTVQSRQKLNINPSRAILDGELIWSYLHLPVPEKAEIAKKIGAKVDDIIEELMELDRMTAHF